MNTAGQAHTNAIQEMIQAGQVQMPGMVRSAVTQYVTIVSIAPISFLKVHRHLRLIDNPTYDPAAPRGSRESFPQVSVHRTPYALPKPELRFDPEATRRDDRTYSLLRVYDTAQLTLDTQSSDKPRQVLKPISCFDAARDLADAFTNTVGARGDSMLGLGIINVDKPTLEDLRHLYEIQGKYASALVAQADQYWYEKEVKRITELHHIMAEWAGVTNKEWVRTLSMNAVKACLACTQMIPSKAIVCPKCNEDLVERAIKMRDYASTEEIAAVDPHCAELAGRAITARKARSKAARRGSQKEEAAQEPEMDNSGK